MTETRDQVRCPTCGKPVAWSRKNASRPFCGERCRLIDLGEWAAENYRIAGEPAAPGDKPDSEPLQ